MNIIASLEKRSKPFWSVIGFVLIGGLGILDFLTGYEISFSLFYLLPISLVVWFTGRRLGVAASTYSAIVWLIADIASGQSYSHPVIYFWNSAIRFGFFIIVTLLLAVLKKALEHEKNLSRIDLLTDATSASFFDDLIQIEIDRLQRYKHPFTVSYIDLDNFKTVNDRYGHRVGNLVLCTIVKHAKTQMCKTDLVARLGGDEFAFLLPETDQETAQAVISRIHLGLLGEMEKNNWPVTFSIGVMTFLEDSPYTTDELIKVVDNLMYKVKNKGKNAIIYSVYTG